MSQGAPFSFPGFFDVASPTGLALAVGNGMTDADFVLETTGNGAGFFDYDNDGDTDVVLVQGSTLAGYAMSWNAALVTQRSGTRRILGLPPHAADAQEAV